MIFAQYREPDSVTIYMDSARRAQELIRRERLEGLLGKQAVEDVLLAHELFHVTEYRKRIPYIPGQKRWSCGESHFPTVPV